jgi:hypothetical protein
MVMPSSNFLAGTPRHGVRSGAETERRINRPPCGLFHGTDAAARRPYLGGWMVLECVVALGILVTVMIPISFSFLVEHEACRGSYYHAVAMELVDGEMEILRAGQWRQFPRGPQPYAVTSAAAKNLPPGRFLLTVEEYLVRLEWQAANKDQGGKVAREAILP